MLLARVIWEFDMEIVDGDIDYSYKLVHNVSGLFVRLMRREQNKS
jgi:hypothetical protein